MSRRKKKPEAEPTLQVEQLFARGNPTIEQQLFHVPPNETDDNVLRLPINCKGQLRQCVLCGQGFEELDKYGQCADCVDKANATWGF